MSGKGDKRRPGDEEAYRESWERIFRNSDCMCRVGYCRDCCEEGCPGLHGCRCGCHEVEK